MSQFDQLLAATGLSHDQLGTPPANLDEGSIALDGEAVRILGLERRPVLDEAFRLALSVYCRTRAVNDAGEPNELWPSQAEALRELLQLGGLLAPMPVGSGKTLVTMLAPFLLNVERVALIIPASLRDKTKRDFARYRRDWKVRLPELISYQEMGRPDRASKLFDTRPQLLMMDEAQWTRNLDSAVARRIERYIEQHHPIVVPLSGTLITDDPMDVHAPAVWSLGQRAPIPIPRADAERWGQALKNTGAAVVGKGALDLIPGGFFEWFRTSRGVVFAQSQSCAASIEISKWRPELPANLRALIDATAKSSMRPDGELLDEWELPDCLCQLAQGFFYVWDPMPPLEWLMPRRGWRTYARWVLDQRLPGFDSESQIVSALDHINPIVHVKHASYYGTKTTVTPASTNLPPSANEGRELLNAWRDVRDTFEPNPVPVWLDATVLKQAADKLRRDPGIAWVRHRAAGWGLEALGVPYYGGGTEPESARPGSAIACSIAAHAEGKNLQAWSRSLVLTPPANAMAWEQLVGRTHRAGQKADLITVEIIEAIDYHIDVVDRVYNQAAAIAKASGFGQKLTLATWL